MHFIRYCTLTLFTLSFIFSLGSKTEDKNLKAQVQIGADALQIDSKVQPAKSENSNLGLSLVSKQNLQKDPSQKLDTGKSNPNKPKLTSNKIVGIGIYILLALSGVYVSLFGFRIFRLLMIILGFYVSYYGVLFLLTEFGVYKADNIGHQIGLVAGCILLGFGIAIVCYMLDKINFIIFGMAVASVIALFVMQFLLDVHDPDGKIYLLAIYGTATIIFSVLSFFILDHFIIWGSAFVGSIITPINLGIVLNDFKPFEERQFIDLDHLQDLKKYLIVCGLLLVVGIGAQYYLRRRIIKRVEESNLEEIRGTSFLN